MNTTQCPEPSDPLLAIEREVQKLKRQSNLSIALWAFVLLYILTRDVAVSTQGGTVRADSVITRTLLIPGPDGEPDIVLANEPNGTPALRFYDSRRKNRLGLGITEAGSMYLNFFDADQKERARISVGASGGKTIGGMFFSGPDKKDVLELNVGPEGNPSMSFLDPKGRTAISMATGRDGTSEFLMNNPNGEGSIHLNTYADSDPVLTLFGKEKQISLEPKWGHR